MKVRCSILDLFITFFLKGDNISVPDSTLRIALNMGSFGFSSLRSPGPIFLLESYLSVLNISM